MKESPCTAEPCLHLIYCQIKLSKCRKVPRAGVTVPLARQQARGNLSQHSLAMNLLGLQSRAQPMLLTAVGTGGSLCTSFRICPPIPTATARKGFLFSRKGPLSPLFGKPASGSSSAKSNFAQELHRWTPKSQRHLQTPSVTKSISNFGVKVYLAIMMRLAQAPFPIPYFFFPRKQQ